MKVVLFCGGFGMRLRGYSEAIPKPMVTIGCRPILWHVMKYYAHFGHKDFILCLGWKADVIREYFLNDHGRLSNDYVRSGGVERVRPPSSDIEDWRIAFVDSGIHANIGQRLKAVQKHLDGEPTFLANYADGLTDLCLPDLIDFHDDRRAVATFLSVRPTSSFHLVTSDDQGYVRNIRPIADANVWMNGGYMIFDRRIFDYIRDGEELVAEPFARLIAERRLATFRYDGFWCCMDTYKEKQMLDDRYARGDTPWRLWDRPAAPAVSLAPVPAAAPAPP